MAHPADLVVITSASGKQCSFLIPLLYDKYPLRLLAYSDRGAEWLRAKYPKAAVEQVDMTEPSQCRRALRDAVVVYHVGPSGHPRETDIGVNMIEAAEHEKKNGAGKLNHFVFSSVLNTQFRKLMNHDVKRYVEEYLLESTLNYTLLKPSDFLDWSVPAKTLLADSKNSSTINWLIEWNKETQSTFTVLQDLAEVAAKVINEREAHFLAEYPLTSTIPINRREIAVVMEKVYQKKVVVNEPTYAEAVDNILTGLYGADPSPRHRDFAERLVLFYWRRGLRGNNNVMRWLLGREPTSLSDWLKAQA